MQKTTTDLSGSRIRHLMYCHHYFRNATRSSAAWGTRGSDTRGKAARCPACSCGFEGGEAHWGAPLVVQGPTVSLFPPELCIKGGKTVLTQSGQICLMSLQEPSCSQNRKEKQFLCMRKEEGFARFWRERKIWFIFLNFLFPKLVLMFLLFQGHAFHSMCPKCAVHIASLLHPAHT